MLRFWDVSQEEDPCFSEMLKDCAAKAMGPWGGDTAHRLHVGVGSESFASLVAKEKEGATCSFTVSKRIFISSNNGLKMKKRFGT